jgi:hypothetical protein
MYDKRTIRIVILFSMTMGILGCQQQSMSRRKARAQIKSTLSLSSETRIFIRQIHNGRLTESFIAGHTEYLKHLQSDLLSEMSKPAADEVADALTVAQKQLLALRDVFPNSTIGESEFRADESRLDDIDSNLNNILPRP